MLLDQASEAGAAVAACFYIMQMAFLMTTWSSRVYKI